MPMALKPGLTPLKNVVVRFIEEIQTLAANQIFVNLAKTNVVPLVVYVAGVRLRVDEK
ncbi:hypothetical protein [Pseudomonas oryzihabitans]|uniref:hypothetical protein n=1 Tax=Pseudomonas oryzihabitans TaxID=47885 RepID=UPI0021C2CDCC|nr:hypothetical protein [Pseudomonas oryzihabitans]